MRKRDELESYPLHSQRHLSVFVIRLNTRHAAESSRGQWIRRQRSPILARLGVVWTVIILLAHIALWDSYGAP